MPFGLKSSNGCGADVKILAVDDEPYILELMPMISARVGFPDVTTVASGQAALDALNATETAFDCLILDINMPGMDGIELCRRVREMPSYRTTPIVMLTAMSERDFLDAAFRAGATDYAAKPFDINELGARLRVAQELMKARQQARDAAGHDPAETKADAGQSRLDPSAALAVDGVRNLVDPVSLSNYLRQLSRAGLAVSQIFSLRLDRFEDLHARATSDELLYALREVADSLNAAVVTHLVLMSYLGNGTFVVVSNAASTLDVAEIEAELQVLLDERNAEFDDGTPMDLEISVGNPIQPPASNATEVEKCVERVVARAVLRSETRRKEVPMRRFHRLRP